MKFHLLGAAIGLAAGLYAVSLGDPQFFTAEHVETVAHHLDPDRFLFGYQPEPAETAGSAHASGGERQDEGDPD